MDTDPVSNGIVFPVDGDMDFSFKLGTVAQCSVAVSLSFISVQTARNLTPPLPQQAMDPSPPAP